LAGPVLIGDWMILRGLSAVHHLLQLGAHAMIGGASATRQDIPHYVMGAGDPFRPVGINSEGLQRRGYDAATIAAVKDAYKLLYRRKLNTDEAAAAMRRLQEERPEASAAVELMAAFVERPGRGIVR